MCFEARSALGNHTVVDGVFFHRFVQAGVGGGYLCLHALECTKVERDAFWSREEGVDPVERLLSRPVCSMKSFRRRPLPIERHGQPSERFQVNDGEAVLDRQAVQRPADPVVTDEARVDVSTVSAGVGEDGLVLDLSTALGHQPMRFLDGDENLDARELDVPADEGHHPESGSGMDSTGRRRPTVLPDRQVRELSADEIPTTVGHVNGHGRREGANAAFRLCERNRFFLF